MESWLIYQWGKRRQHWRSLFLIFKALVISLAILVAAFAIIAAIGWLVVEKRCWWIAPGMALTAVFMTIYGQVYILIKYRK